MLTLSKRDDLFPLIANDFFKPWNDWFDNRLSRNLLMPAVNITEKDEAFIIYVAAPGLKKTDFSIAVDDNILTVSAESEKNKEEGDNNYTRQEFNYSSFSRSLTLPGNADEDKITASYDGGVLKLFVPKKEGVNKVTGKQITVS